MKSILRISATVAIVVMLAALTGCSSSGGASQSAGSSAVAMGKTLYQQLGGANGVTQLANQFGANIKSNPTLNTIIDAVAIGNIQTGLTNDIMKASNMTPSNSTTLQSALAGKDLGAAEMGALSSALTDAGKSMSLDATTIASLSSLLKPLTGM